MTLDGAFRRPVRPPIAARVAGIAIVVAVVAGMLSAAALAIWFALALIPVALIAGLVAWVAFRVQLWRVRRARQAGRTVYRA